MDFMGGLCRLQSISIATGYGLDNGVWWFDSWQGLGIFLFFSISKLTLGSTQPPIQWVPGALSPGIKQPVCEADHSPSSVHLQVMVLS